MRKISGVAGTTGTDVEVEYHPAWKSEKVYVCPGGIYIHKAIRVLVEIHV